MKAIMQFPLTKVILGLALCYLPLLLLNLLVFKPITAKLGLSEEIGRAIRFSTNILVLFFMYGFFLRYIEKSNTPFWKGANIFSDILTGGGLAIASILIIILILFLLGFYKFGTAQFSTRNIMYLLLVFAFMSVMEEVLFRGVIYQLLEKSLGTIIALLISALLFGIPHLFNQDTNWVSMFAASVGGLILGLMFTATRNIWMPIAFHWMWNFTQVIFGSYLSGSDEFIPKGLFQAKINGPIWATGGAAGIENSAFTIGLTILVGIGLLYYVYNQALLIIPKWIAN